MRKTFQYRLYPTAHQGSIMLRMLEECRCVFNQTLAYRKDAWEQRQEFISLYQTNKLLPSWKRERPSMTAVYSQVFLAVQQRIDLAFKAFFRRVKAGEQPGYPRFRGQGRYASFTYPQFGFSLGDGTVKAALLTPSDKAVGIDVGLESLATLSNGEKVPNPRFFRDAEKTLAKAQR